MRHILLTSFLLLSGLLNAQVSRVWGTYYGQSADNNVIQCSVTDFSGNIYVAGVTNSTTGVSFNGFQNTYGGGTYDAFLVKFDANGNRIWATYYGGTQSEWGFGLAIDNFGNVYLTGFTGSSSGIASGGFDNVFGGGTDDAFLVKFDTNGNRIWATYYGGGGDDIGLGITVDNNGNIYMCGRTLSNNDISSGGFQNTYGGGEDAFLVKFDANGNRIWATYYGGTEGDVAEGVSTDSNGNVYIGGMSFSLTGIASGGFQNSYGGGFYDAMIVKFDANGNRIWASYYGGSGNDWAIGGVATDNNGNVYLAGQTTSTTNIASGGFQNTFGGVYDAFIVKFTSSGNRAWGTYYGGAGYDTGEGLTTDNIGNVYITGQTSSTTNIASGGFQNSYGGGLWDAYLVKFNSTGNRVWGTYYGGSADDWGNTVTDVVGNIYLSGYTFSSNSIANNGFQNTYGGGQDGFLVKFSVCTPDTTTLIETSCDSYTLNSITYDSTGNYYQSFVNNSDCDSTIWLSLTIHQSPNVTILYPSDTSLCKTDTPINLTGQPTGGNYSGTGVVNNTFNPSLANNGSNTITYTITDAFGCTGTDNTTITVNPLPNVDYSITDSLCQGSTPLQLSGGSPIGGTYIGNGVSNGTLDPSTLNTGETEVLYSYQDGNGCAATDTSTFVILADVAIGTINGQANVNTGANQTYSVSNNPNFSYFWTVTGGTLTTGQGTSSITVLWSNNEGNGSISVLVDNTVCSDTTSINISITKTSLPENFAAFFDLYPNPVTDVLNISLKNTAKKAQVEVYNTNGKLVYSSGSISTNNIQIPTVGFAAGFYSVKINVDGAITHKTFIKD
jgi:hypothetical protein